MAKETTKQRTGVQLDSKYAVVALPIDYALARVYTDEKGAWFKPFAYFGTFERCLTEYVRSCAHDALDADSIISITEAEKRIENAVREAEKAIKTKYPTYKVTEG